MPLLVNEDFTISITQSGGAFPGKTSGNINDIKTKTKDVNCSAPVITSPTLLKKAIMTTSMEHDDAFASWGCQGPLTKSGTGDLISTIIKGTFTLNASSTKMKCSGNNIHLEGESIVCQCSGTEQPTAGGSPVPFTGSCTIKIDSAGQSKVSGI